MKTLLLSILLHNLLPVLSLTCRIALKRGDAVSREVMKKFADDKKMSKQEKEERFVCV